MSWIADFFNVPNYGGTYKATFRGKPIKWSLTRNQKRVEKVEYDGETIRGRKFFRDIDMSYGAFLKELTPPEDDFPEDTQGPGLEEDRSFGNEDMAQSESMLGDAGSQSTNYDLITPGMSKDPVDPDTGIRAFKKEVVPLQQLLQAADEDLGPDGVDGRFGDITEEALIKFQAKNGLAPTGEVTEDTLELLKRHNQDEVESAYDIMD